MQDHLGEQEDSRGEIAASSISLFHIRYLTSDIGYLNSMPRSKIEGVPANPASPRTRVGNDKTGTHECVNARLSRLQS
jgi:hypothetical protein